MKNYSILETNDKIYPLVCFVNDVEDLHYSLENIKSDTLLNGHSKILVDLFLTNGFNFNRFFEIEFSGTGVSKIIINSRFIANEVIEVINNYIKNNIQLLAQSALSVRVIEIVKKRLANICSGAF